MVRPFVGDEPLTEVVKFRLTASELELLRAMAPPGEVSPLLRRLLHEEAHRLHIRL